MFDQQTQLCLACHDGIMSTDVTISRSGGFRDALSEHPVGVSMENLQSAKPNPEPMMHAPAVIDPRIKLFDNRVGCTSCHSPFSRESKLLVMSNHNSNLCLNCHGD
jgi:predicted CXXCH cytochrome family protein